MNRDKNRDEINFTKLLKETAKLENSRLKNAIAKFLQENKEKIISLKGTGPTNNYHGGFLEEVLQQTSVVVPRDADDWRTESMWDVSQFVWFGIVFKNIGRLVLDSTVTDKKLIKDASIGLAEGLLRNSRASKEVQGCCLESLKFEPSDEDMGIINDILEKKHKIAMDMSKKESSIRSASIFE